MQELRDGGGTLEGRSEGRLRKIRRRRQPQSCGIIGGGRGPGQRGRGVRCPCHCRRRVAWYCMDRQEGAICPRHAILVAWPSPTRSPSPSTCCPRTTATSCLPTAAS